MSVSGLVFNNVRVFSFVGLGRRATQDWQSPMDPIASQPYATVPHDLSDDDVGFF